MTGDRFDFHVVDSVYGRNSDLYVDVLGVPPTASRKEIRAAFVDSRDEFFQFQSQVEKGDIVVTDGQLDFSKRRMDAVVAAFRILHDPNLRAFYDEAREKRMQQGKTQEDPKDPVVQAVSRALGEKSPSRSNKASGTGRSPLESSSGADTPSSSIIIERRTPSSSTRRKLKGAFSSKRVKAPSSTIANANYYMDEQQPKSALRTSKYQDSSSSSSILVSDDTSVASHDIGSSRNYRAERRRSHDTVSTEASSTKQEMEEASSYHRDETNSLLANTDIIDDASTAASYYIDDEILVVEEDLGTICCSNRGRSRDRTLVSKTRTLLRAVKAEIRGSIKDTSSAIDQVCNAFTLQEQDIAAVTSKIDKASRQLANG